MGCVEFSANLNSAEELTGEVKIRHVYVLHSIGSLRMWMEYRI